MTLPLSLPCSQKRLRADAANAQKRFAAESLQPLKQTVTEGNRLTGNDFNQVIKYVLDKHVGSKDPIVGVNFLAHSTTLMQGGLRSISLEYARSVDLTMEELGDHVSGIVPKSVILVGFVACSCLVLLLHARV